MIILFQITKEDITAVLIDMGLAFDSKSSEEFFMKLDVKQAETAAMASDDLDERIAFASANLESQISNLIARQSGGISL